jgi:hypothetical protein
MVIGEEDKESSRTSLNQNPLVCKSTFAKPTSRVLYLPQELASLPLVVNNGSTQYMILFAREK